MANGGRRPGAGRKAGGKTKATLLREQKVAAVIDRSRREGRELGIDVLERMMKLCEGAAAEFRPTTQKDVAKGATLNPDGDEPVFGQWVDRTIFCAKEIAKYETPQLRAIMVHDAGRGATPASEAERSNVVRINDPLALSRRYEQLMKRPAA